MKQIKQYKLFKHQAEDLLSLIQMGLNESANSHDTNTFFNELANDIEKHIDRRDLVTITIYDPI